MPYPRLAAPSIFLLIAVAHSNVAGQVIPSPYTFIEYGQAYAIFWGKSDLNPGQLGIGPRDATAYGTRFAVAFGGAFNLDVDATFFASSREVLDPSRPEDDRSLGRANFNIILVDPRLRLNLTGHRAWHGLQPFVLFGGGFALTVGPDRSLELTEDMPLDEWYELGTRFTGTFGGGTNLHISDRVSLRLDGVVHLWKITTPVGWLTVENNPNGEYPEGEWVSVKTIRLGASWRR